MWIYTIKYEILRYFSDCKQAVDMFLASMREKEHYMSVKTLKTFLVF